MDFPITDLMDEDACYTDPLRWLHADGLACPRCHRSDRMRVQRSHRAPVRAYRCGHCHRVFNAYTGTILHGTRRRPRELVLIVRGFAQDNGDDKESCGICGGFRPWSRKLHRVSGSAN